MAASSSIPAPNPHDASGDATGPVRIQAIRAKLEERAARALGEVLSGLSAEQQLEALSQPTDYHALVEALLASEVPPIVYDKGLYEARLRGLEAKRQLAAAEGGSISGRQLAETLQISRQAVEKRRESGSLFGLRFPNSREWYYPVWQFDDHWSPLAGLERVLKALPKDDAWGVMIFFRHTETPAGEIPLQALRAGRIEDALEAAARYGVQGAT